MPVQSSGPISFADINTEFARGATTQLSMSQLYRNGGIVGAGAPNVPTSGAISLSQFYGAANAFAFNQTISSNTTNYNLRTAAIAAGWDGVIPLNANITVNSGVYVSGNSTGTPAFATGTIPSGSTLALTNNGFIVGMGGAGGAGVNITQPSSTTVATNGGSNGSSGGTAFSSSYPISVTNNGTIAGGGGGGGGGGATYRQESMYFSTYYLCGGGGGGGGRSSQTNSSGGARGTEPGGQSIQPIAGSAGSVGTVSTNGTGGLGSRSPNRLAGAFNGGNGGGWGAAGANATVANGANISVDSKDTNTNKLGGSAGAAVSGNSNITWLATGTRLGAIT